MVNKVWVVFLLCSCTGAGSTAGDTDAAKVADASSIPPSVVVTNFRGPPVSEGQVHWFDAGGNELRVDQVTADGKVVGPLAALGGFVTFLNQDNAFSVARLHGREYHLFAGPISQPRGTMRFHWTGAPPSTTSVTVVTACGQADSQSASAEFFAGSVYCTVGTDEAFIALATDATGAIVGYAFGQLRVPDHGEFSDATFAWQTSLDTVSFQLPSDATDGGVKWHLGRAAAQVNIRPSGAAYDIQIPSTPPAGFLYSATIHRANDRSRSLWVHGATNADVTVGDDEWLPPIVNARAATAGYTAEITGLPSGHYGVVYARQGFGPGQSSSRVWTIVQEMPPHTNGWLTVEKPPQGSADYAEIEPMSISVYDGSWVGAILDGLPVAAAGKHRASSYSLE